VTFPAEFKGSPVDKFAAVRRLRDIYLVVTDFPKVRVVGNDGPIKDPALR
jgi:hypothetical protein